MALKWNKNGVAKCGPFKALFEKYEFNIPKKGVQYHWWIVSRGVQFARGVSKNDVKAKLAAECWLRRHAERMLAILAVLEK